MWTWPAVIIGRFGSGFSNTRDISYISVSSWRRPAEEQIALLIMESCQASGYIGLDAPFTLPSGALISVSKKKKNAAVIYFEAAEEE